MSIKIDETIAGEWIKCSDRMPEEGYLFPVCFMGKQQH